MTMLKQSASPITRATLLAFIPLGLLFSTAGAQIDRQADLAKARATNPVTLGWMVGAPPPPDKDAAYGSDS